MGREGTLNKLQKGGIIDPGNFELVYGVLQSLGHLGDMGYFLAILSVERAALPDMDYPARMQWVKRFIGGQVAFPLEFFTCYHAFNEPCECRLPRTGLFEQVFSRWNIDTAECYMIASREKEAQGALNAGLSRGHVLRVGTGRGQWTDGTEKLPLYETILQATEAIIGHEVAI